MRSAQWTVFTSRLPLKRNFRPESEVVEGLANLSRPSMPFQPGHDTWATRLESEVLPFLESERTDRQRRTSLIPHFA
jgi:hypothetical protein